VERLAATGVQVITVAASPGYGKTTLMAQWAERIGSRVAWLSCDEEDNDPVVLLSALAVALNRIGPVDPAIFSALASSAADITMVPGFVSAVASVQPPVTVLLDHAEDVTNRQRPNTIAEFAVRLPPGWQLALASRTAVPLPTARLRAQGGILEVTADDLAMAPLEAGTLLKGRESRPTRRAFVISCSGPKAGQPGCISPRWPSSPAAGTAMSASRSAAMTSTWAIICAQSSLTGSPVRKRRSSLARRSWTGCAGQSVTRSWGRRDLAVLDQMEARNLLVVPLGRRREWYYHLLRDLLRAELRRREPGLIQDLHFRAATWFEANGRASPTCWKATRPEPGPFWPAHWIWRPTSVACPLPT
jgi:LuxR family maltose regulon positive regulatory protein